MQRDQILDNLQSCLNFKIKNKEMFLKCFDRKTLNNEQSFQRFEFIGDRVLNLVVAEYLEKKMPSELVGSLQNVYSKMVSNKTCLPEIAREYYFDKLIMMNDTEKNHKLTDGMLADHCEAFFGVLYKDQGFEKTKKIILELWKTYLPK